MNAVGMHDSGGPKQPSTPPYPPGPLVLYVGPLWDGSTCLQRMLALDSLGCRIVPVDTLPAPARRLSQSVAYRMVARIFGPMDLAGTNRLLLSQPESIRPDIIWVDKGLALEESSLIALKARWPASAAVSYAGDDMFNPRNQSRQYSACIPLFDVHVTTKPHNVAELRDAGAKDVYLLDPGFSSAVHRPMRVTPHDVHAIGGAVGFVGWPESDRSRSLCYLAASGVPVRVWGPWHKWRRYPPNLRVEGRPLWGADYARAIGAFKINLCFLRKANRDRHTSRSIEIPACGGFMLAERTDEHLRLFREDQEAVFFSTDDELLEKVRYYLAHDDERERIAAAGRRRCLEGGYANEKRLGRLLDYVLQMRAPACGGSQ